MRHLHFGGCASNQETVGAERWDMRLQRASFITANITAKALLWAAMILVCPAIATAQHHGHGFGASIPGPPTRPDGVDEKDTLKDFHHALAVQATSQQIAEFQTLVKNAEAAKAELQQFQQQQSKETDAAESARNAALDQALQKARSETQEFIGGFSDAQKSGLKEITKRLGKADSDLEQEEKKLDQSLQTPKVAAPEVAAEAESLDKALTDFSNQQLALGKEMGITLAAGQDLTFTLPSVNSPASIANRTVAVAVSGALSQVAVEGSRRTFKFDLVADLSDLQQSITELLRVQLDRANRCGERVAVRQAMLSPSPPATLVAVQLHLERWTCTQMVGRVVANELAESDASIEIRLTPGVEKSNTLELTSEFGRIEASGMMADALRSGDLGNDLRDKVTQSILSALRAGADFKRTLPPVLQSGAVIQSAKFQDAAGTLRVVLEGQIQISSEQADLLASELNQALSSRETPQ
jgi:hypothetical protein